MAKKKPNEVPITEHDGFFPSVILDLDDDAHVGACDGWGGKDLIRVIIRKNGKETHAYLHCHVSTGSPNKADITLVVKRPDGETKRKAVAKPWIVRKDK